MVSRKFGEVQDLFEVHRKQLTRILHLNRDAKPIDEFQQEEDEFVWKILIHDQFGKDSLSTVFKIGDLRTENVTLHLNLFAEREKIHGVNALYLVQPSTENINQIIEDISQDLYDSMYINFTHPIRPENLQKLANAIGKYSAISKIQQIQQHYLDFVALSQKHFTFSMKQIYLQLKTLTSDQKFEKLDHIAMSLFSVLKSLGIVPIIQYQPGIGQEIATRLEGLYMSTRDEDEECWKTQSLLILTTRDIDIAPMLFHPWHYAALLNDVLGISNNRVVMQNEITKNIKEEYDFDPKYDLLWSEKMNIPFPFVAEDIDIEMNRWKEEYEAMDHRRKAEDMTEISKNLSGALDKIPEMTDRKKRLDMHANIATHLFNEIKNRGLDKLFELESKVIFNKNLSTQEKADVFTFLESQNTTSPEVGIDKVRLAAILYQNMHNLSPKDQERIELALEKIAEFKAYLYLKEHKATLAGIKAGSTEGTTVQEKESKSLFKGITDKLKSQSKDFLRNFQGYLPSASKEFLIARVVQKIIENRGTSSFEAFKTMNILPKLQNVDVVQEEDCMVFMIDAGSYNDFQNLSDLAKKSNIKLIYGCSHFYSGGEFVKECSALSTASK